jgi:hypothetical protein
MFNSGQADFRFGVSGLGARKMPSVDCVWPDGGGECQLRDVRSSSRLKLSVEDVDPRFPIDNLVSTLASGVRDSSRLSLQDDPYSTRSILFGILNAVHI